MIDTPRAPASGPADQHHGWPVLRSLQGYRPWFLTHDLVAGLTLAAIAIPEQLATARLGGFSPQIGFFAFLAGSLAFAIFGSNRFLSSGADSTITPIFAGGLALLAVSGSPEYAALAGVLALMVGVVLVVGGIFRLGWIADLLSVPVTVGFLAGISVHILISQMPAILGLALAERPDAAAPGDAGGATAADQSVFARHRPWRARVDRDFGADRRPYSGRADRPGRGRRRRDVRLDLESRGVAVLGNIPVALPTLAIPEVPISRWLQLVPLTLIIAVIVMVQTAATTRSFVSDPNEPPDVDRDFVGVGAGSILAGLIGAFPVNASPPRTAIVSETGGRSQLAVLAAAAIVLGLLAFGSSLLRHVPQAALGGVLLFVALRIIRVSQIVAIYRQSLGEFLLIVATAAAIIILPIEQGVGIGIALSLLHGIWSTTRARLTVFERVPGTSIWWPSSQHIPGESEPNIMVVGFQAPLSFLNAYPFRRDMVKLLQSPPQQTRLIVLEATGIVEIDFTAAQILSDTIRACRAAGADFTIARLESIRAQDALERSGIMQLLAADRLFHSVEEAIRAWRGQAGAK